MAKQHKYAEHPAFQLGWLHIHLGGGCDYYSNPFPYNADKPDEFNLNNNAFEAGMQARHSNLKRTRGGVIILPWNCDGISKKTGLDDVIASELYRTLFKGLKGSMDADSVLSFPSQYVREKKSEPVKSEPVAETAAGEDDSDSEGGETDAEEPIPAAAPEADDDY